MKNIKKTVLKGYSTALLTIGSIISGAFNCLFYYVYGGWIYVYFIGNVLIFLLLTYLCWRVNEKLIEETWQPIYTILMTVVIPFGIGSFLSQSIAISI